MARRSGRGDGLQPVGVPVGDDPAGGGRGEVGAQQEGVRAGEGGEQRAAGGLGPLGVDVDAGADGGVGERPTSSAHAGRSAGNRVTAAACDPRAAYAS